MKKICSFLLVTLLVFLASRFLIRTLPGDPIENILAETGTRISPELIRTELGLDRPPLESLVRDAKRFLQGDFGKSILTGEAVAPALWKRIHSTWRLAFLTFSFALLLSLTLGLLAAASVERPQLRWIDRFCTHFGAWTSALPTPWLGPVLMYFLAVKIPLFPIASRENGEWSDYFLAAFTLGLVFSGLWSRLIRERVRESLFQGSAKGARARGISEPKIILKYGLAPVAGPLLAYLGSQAGALLSGALITETIFNIRGLGTFLVEAVLSRDYPAFEAAAFFVALFSLAGTYMGDWLNEKISPV